MRLFTVLLLVIVFGLGGALDFPAEPKPVLGSDLQKVSADASFVGHVPNQIVVSFTESFLENINDEELDSGRTGHDAVDEVGEGAGGGCFIGPEASWPAAPCQSPKLQKPLIFRGVNGCSLRRYRRLTHAATRPRRRRRQPG